MKIKIKKILKKAVNEGLIMGPINYILETKSNSDRKKAIRSNDDRRKFIAKIITRGLRNMFFLQDYQTVELGYPHIYNVTRTQQRVVYPISINELIDNYGKMKREFSVNAKYIERLQRPPESWETGQDSFEELLESPKINQPKGTVVAMKVVIDDFTADNHRLIWSISSETPDGRFPVYNYIPPKIDITNPEGAIHRHKPFGLFPLYPQEIESYNQVKQEDLPQ